MSKFVRIVSVLSLLVVVMAIGTGVASASRPDGEDSGNGNGHETIISMPTRTIREARGSNRPGGSNLLAYRGGAVQTNTKVYISYWGSEWSTGFGTAPNSSADAQNYVNAFFGAVGHSLWINTDTEYCQGVATGSTSCAGALSLVTNPTGQLKGTWNDPTPVPSSPTQSQIAAAAIRLQGQFGYDSSATYMVFTPSGKSMSGFGTQWCAWHSSTSVSSGPLAYAYIPYMPDAGGNCGMNWPTPGYFNGFSIVAGHEYEEAQTDPFPNGGWLDRYGSEDADKCAWNSLSTSISLTSGPFVVQPVWSNKTGGCVAPTSGYVTP